MDSLSTAIMQRTNSYHHDELTIFMYHVARGYDILQRWTCVISQSEQPYFTNCLEWLVGFNKFFTFHLNMGPAQWGNTCWPKLTLQNSKIWHSVSELTSTTIDETALTILKKQGSWGNKMVSSPWKFIFDSLIVSVLIQLPDNPLQTANEGLPNYQRSPRHMESLPHIRMRFGSYSMEWYIKSEAMTVIWCIMQWAGASIFPHP